MKKYSVFKNLGKNKNISIDYKNIRVYFVYNVKHDSRHRARLVTDKYFTDIPINNIYSGIVSLRDFRFFVFLI